MDIEVPEARDKRLNQAVAITVVVFSVFLGLCNVKDGNLVQSMQQAKADAVDTWGEYQAAKTKLHIDETALDQLTALPDTSAQKARLAPQIAKYNREIPVLADKARGFEHQYDALNIHDDQFDAADALMSIAVSVAAVAALTDIAWVLAVGWVFGIFGAVMGLAGFAGWSLHSAFLAHLLS